MSPRWAGRSQEEKGRGPGLPTPVPPSTFTGSITQCTQRGGGPGGRAGNDLPVGEDKLPHNRHIWLNEQMNGPQRCSGLQ